MLQVGLVLLVVLCRSTWSGAPCGDPEEEHPEECGGRALAGVLWPQQRGQGSQQEVGVPWERLVGAVAASVLVTFVVGFSAGALGRTHVLRCLHAVRRPTRQTQGPPVKPRRSFRPTSTVQPPIYLEIYDITDHNHSTKTEGGDRGGTETQGGDRAETETQGGDGRETETEGGGRRETERGGDGGLETCDITDHCAKTQGGEKRGAGVRAAERGESQGGTETGRERGAIREEGGAETKAEDRGSGGGIEGGFAEKEGMEEGGAEEEEDWEEEEQEEGEAEKEQSDADASRGRRVRVIRVYQYDEEGQRYPHLSGAPAPAPGPTVTPRSRSLSRLHAIMSAATEGPMGSEGAQTFETIP
uniref:Uncharacterized protein n=1 Tax=Knipowitschia caucasica TaxID=637954 RepID=A0AAV2J7Z2_KNICA